MSKVTVTLNSREFTIGCEAGQEAYLTELAADLDRKVSAIVGEVGQIGDLRLLLMASLILVDEGKEAGRRVEALEGQLERLRHERHGAASMQAEERGQLAHQLTGLAERLEAFAAGLDEDPTVDDGGPDGDATHGKTLFAEARA